MRSIRDAESRGEGTVFAVPLPNDEYVLGVVLARHVRVVRVGLSSRPITGLPPSPASVSPGDVEIVTKVLASALDDGRWPVVGVIQDFVTAEWPNAPMLPGEKPDEARTPSDLERHMVDVVEGARRRGVRPVTDEGLIPVEHQQGRRYAELVLGHGQLLARMVKDSIDLDAGTFAATLAFIEHEGEWYTGVASRTATDVGWALRDDYEAALVPTLHRFLADPSHSAVFDYSFLELPREASQWQRIENERFGPLEIFPLQIFYRDEGSRREMYAGVGGGDIDEATTADMLSSTFDPVIAVILMLDVAIEELPTHAQPIGVDQLAALAQRVKGFALRWTSYDGYLIWEPT